MEWESSDRWKDSHMEKYPSDTMVVDGNNQSYRRLGIWLICFKILNRWTELRVLNVWTDSRPRMNKETHLKFRSVNICIIIQPEQTLILA